MSILLKCKKALFGLRSVRGRRALGLGVGAVIEHTRILKDAAPGVIVDIGANRGQFSLLASELLPQARIEAFEPLEGPGRKFSAVFVGAENVTLHPLAIGAKSETAMMHVSASDDSSSLLAIGQRQLDEFPGTQEVSVVSVRVETLKEALPDEFSEAFLKIDVQGYEMPVLLGCEEVLHRFKHVYVETSFVELYEGQALITEVCGFLFSRGFVLSDVGGWLHGRDGRALQGDLLFSRRLS